MLGWHRRSRVRHHRETFAHPWLAEPIARPLRFDPTLRTASELVAREAGRSGVGRSGS